MVKDFFAGDVTLTGTAPGTLVRTVTGSGNTYDVAVTGMPNPILGQVVVAQFNLSTPEDLPALRQRMREYCRGRLAPYKIPAKIEIVKGTL